MTIPLEKYQTSELDYVYVVPRIETEHPLTEVLEFLSNDSSLTKLTISGRDPISYIPISKIRLEKSGKEPIHLEWKQQTITKGDLVFWDIITSNNWERPVCFTSLADPEEHGLKNNLIFDGLIYRLNDQKSEGKSVFELGKIETESLYTKLIKICNWENLSNTSVYFDWHHRRMIASMQIRNAFYRLAKSLSEEKQTDRVVEVLKKEEKTLSLKLWPVDYQSILMASLYAPNGQKQLGEVRFKELAESLEEMLGYFVSFPSQERKSITYEARYQLSLYNELIIQAAGTLSDAELKSMQNKLMLFAGELG